MLTPNQETFIYWIKERESIRVKKELGLPKPWTDDPIFQRYKFCNVERENDMVTKWIKTHWRQPFEKNSNMWFAMIVARLFNWPPTLEAIGFPALLDEEFYEWKEVTRQVLKHIRDDKGDKVFTGAYLVSTNGVSMDKIDYILDRVLTPIWEKGWSPSRLYFIIKPEFKTLETYWIHLLKFDGLGSFMAGQVIADLKYVDPILKEAPDWWTWAPLGPGSIRGLNRFADRPVDKSLNQHQGLAEIRGAQKLIEERLEWVLPAHDVQNCFCETDKYLRVKNGEGRPRSTYPGV